MTMRQLRCSFRTMREVLDHQAGNFGIRVPVATHGLDHRPVRVGHPIHTNG
jgi:hypothetical protein